MSEIVKESTFLQKSLKNQHLIVLGPVLALHFFILSFITGPTLEFEVSNKLNKQNLIRLDQFTLKKEDLKPQIFTTHPGKNLIQNQAKAMDLKSLQLNPNFNSPVAITNPEIKDQVSELKAANLKVNNNDNPGVSLIERNEARELLLRHRKRLRTPEVQMDQENKLQKINNQIGSTIPGKLSDFNFSIVPNSKLSKEELNSIEKKFYAFHVRLSEKYTGTISSQFIRGMQIRPQLKNSLLERHVLQAKIVYDKNGNTVVTKILKSSDANEVHLTFEDILADFGIPNVPKELLDEEEQFTVYFTLVIN